MDGNFSIGSKCILLKGTYTQKVPNKAYCIKTYFYALFSFIYFTKSDFNKRSLMNDFIRK